mgnify:CR=1 FL=1
MLRYGFCTVNIKMVGVKIHGNPINCKIFGNQIHKIHPVYLRIFADNLIDCFVGFFRFMLDFLLPTF